MSIVNSKQIENNNNFYYSVGSKSKLAKVSFEVWVSYFFLFNTFIAVVVANSSSSFLLLSFFLSIFLFQFNYCCYAFQLLPSFTATFCQACCLFCLWASWALLTFLLLYFSLFFSSSFLFVTMTRKKSYKTVEPSYWQHHNAIVSCHRNNIEY